MQQALTKSMHPVLTSNPTELVVPSWPSAMLSACTPPCHFATHGRPGCLPPPWPPLLRCLCSGMRLSYITWAPRNPRADPGPPDLPAMSAVNSYGLGNLLTRCRFVSDTRVVDGSKVQVLGGMTFGSYGAHCAASYPHKYLTAAAALGTTCEDVDEFCVRLLRCFQEYKRKSTGVPRGVAIAGGADARGGAVREEGQQAAGAGGEVVLTAADAKMARLQNGH
jgi:hypothetical protein